IACIFDAALRDFFGLAERSAHADDCGLMFFGPRLPSGYPLFLLRESLRFWQGIPCCHSRGRLAAEKLALMRFPFLYVLRVQTKARCIAADGVGPVVALTYRVTVVPARFRNSKAVGAVFGLTPAKYQSGENDRTGQSHVFFLRIFGVSARR